MSDHGEAKVYMHANTRSLPRSFCFSYFSHYLLDSKHPSSPLI